MAREQTLEIEGLHILSDDGRQQPDNEVVGLSMEEGGKQENFTWDNVFKDWLCSPRASASILPDDATVFPVDAEVYDSHPTITSSRTSRSSRYRHHTFSSATTTTATSAASLTIDDTWTEKAKHKKHLSKSTLALIAGDSVCGTDAGDQQTVRREEDEE